MLDLTGVYDVPDRQSLWVAEWDAHPNAKGHRLVADKLQSLVLANERALFGCGEPPALVAAATASSPVHAR